MYTDSVAIYISADHDCDTVEKKWELNESHRFINSWKKLSQTKEKPKKSTE